ncbi:MAG: hypothetical protein Q9227_001496 [Pyrenula ochraceoflavens]
MGEKEDKEKAEKLAAAKKRVAQLQKAKKKAATSGGAEKSTSKSKDETLPAPEETVQEKSAEAHEEEPKDEETDSASPAKKTEVNDAESLPEAQTVLSPQEEPSATIPEESNATSKPTHGRQPSLSLQSKLRSTSFRRTSTAGPVSPALNPPAIPDAPDGDSSPEIYRKQQVRISELELENRRLEKAAKDSETRWRKTEEELEDLREANGEAVALRQKIQEAEQSQSEIERLRSEIASLQRQTQSTRSSHSHSISRAGATPPNADADTAALRAEIQSKLSTITDMELEISNLRAQLSSQTSSCSTHGEQITALQSSLTASESKITSLRTELTDTKKALARASEKAVQAGVEQTSITTRISTLERDLSSSQSSLTAAETKGTTLEKKLETLTKLHREAETRHTAKLAAAESSTRETSLLRAKLASIENENLRLREERERRKKREATGATDAELDELEDEERSKLERQVRELEGEVFDLRRGVWRDRRRELQPGSPGEVDGPGLGVTSPEAGAADDFDEVDLSGPSYSSHHSRRRSLAAQAPQKHSSFSTVLSSGLAAFRGESPAAGGGANNRPRQMSLATNTSSLLEDDDADGIGGFDEAAFRVAQREEEARKMVEHVREVKKGLTQWKGWRLDLVESRKIGGEAGVGVGEVFEV